MFPFARFPGVDTVLGPEMRSTGEVMGSTARSTSPSPRASSARAPACRRRRARSSSRSATPTRRGSSSRCASCQALGFKILATGGTQRYLTAHGLAGGEDQQGLGGPPARGDAIKNGGVQLVFNTTEGATSLADSKPLRRAALLQKMPYYTTLAGAIAAAEGIKAYSAAISKCGRCRTICA